VKRKMPTFWPLPMTPFPFFPIHAHIFRVKPSVGQPEDLETIALPFMSGKYVSRNPARDSLPDQTEPALGLACAINKLSSRPKNNHVGRTRFAA